MSTKQHYVYQPSEGGNLFTVGFYDPQGRWVPESDHGTKEEAALQVSLLNGGSFSVDVILQNMNSILRNRANEIEGLRLRVNEAECYTIACARQLQEMKNERDQLSKQLADSDGIYMNLSGSLDRRWEEVERLRAENAQLRDDSAREGYIAGYEQGHHDTVESRYGDPADSANDWFDARSREAEQEAQPEPVKVQCECVSCGESFMGKPCEAVCDACATF